MPAAAPTPGATGSPWRTASRPSRRARQRPTVRRQGCRSARERPPARPYWSGPSAHRWCGAGAPRSPAGGVFKVGEEPVDDPPLPVTVLQRLPDDPPGQVDGKSADLRAQLGEGVLAVRLDPSLGARGDLGRLLLRAGAQLLDDPLPLHARLLAHPGRLGPGLGELGAVLLQGALRLLLRLVGPGDPALDALGALVVNPLDRRECCLPQQRDQDREGDETDDQLAEVRDERVVLRGKRDGGQAHDARPRAYLPKTNGMTRPMRASACISPRASGGRATPETYAAKIRPMPMPGPIALLGFALAEALALIG